jgi:EKC/KEOPS complex subunit CGI121/TPRKB
LQVGESLKRFGLSPKSTSLLLVKFSSSDADPDQILKAMTEVVGPNLTLPSTQAEESVDLDQAIRFGRYLPPGATAQPVTDWKELNKIYKLQIDAKLLASADTQSWHQRCEDIICTSVAMKLVAA